MSDFSFDDFDKALSKIKGFEHGSILENNVFSNVKEWINTGNYLLNAQISGSLFGGFPVGRISAVGGDPGCMQKNQRVRIYKLKSDLYNEHKRIEE